MNEMRTILDFVENMQALQPVALATVVDLQGSAYRHPGARMLTTASGPSAGMISGGCLEDDVKERARAVIASGNPLLVTYDSTSPEDIVFGMGLGCNGIVHILIEPLQHAEEEGLLAFLKACNASSSPGHTATVFATTGVADAIFTGARLLAWPDGKITANFDHSTIRPLLASSPHLTSGRRANVQDIALPSGGSLRVLFETLSAPVPLVIFGGGEDAIPLVKMAKQLGRPVTVVDARPAYALPERFPEADAILCVRTDSIPESLFATRPQVMIMTHNYTRDKELLRRVLPMAPSYTGILGPKARTRRLLDELASEGVTFSESSLAGLHGPAGLDIGADTPAQIALSILAEMQAGLTGHAGGSLRERTGSIHASNP